MPIRGRWAHVGLATGHVADVLGVGEHQLKAALARPALHPSGTVAATDGKLLTTLAHEYVAQGMVFEKKGVIAQPWGTLKMSLGRVLCAERRLRDRRPWRSNTEHLSWRPDQTGASLVITDRSP
jgi:hypothetical protein